MNKNISEFARILHVSDAVHKHKVTVQITEQLLRQRHIQNTVKHIWWSFFCKKNNAWVQGHNQKFFREGEVLWN